MHRKLLPILIPLLILAGILTAVFCFTAETREYSFTDLLSADNQTKNFQTGGSLRLDDLKKYRIIYDDSFTKEEIALVNALRDSILTKTGISLEIYNASTGKHEDTYTVAKHELLIGFTCRPESTFLTNQTWEGSASCTMIGKKLVLAIGEQADPVRILNRFADLIEKNCESDGEFFFKDSDAFVDTGSAPVRSLYLNDLPITEYAIVLPSDKNASLDDENRFLAETFRQELGDICGHLLPILSTEDTKDFAGTIHISVAPTLDSLLNDVLSPTAETAFWQLYAEEVSIHATGTAPYCVVNAVNALLERLTPAEPADSYSVTVGNENPVPMSTDISLLRIDMMNQWPAITLLQEYVYEDFPDIFILENASDSLGFTFTSDFDGYYTCHPLDISCNVYFSTSRFQVVEEDEIKVPENGDPDNTLRAEYLILRDVMTWEEIVVFTSDVTDNTVDAFEDFLHFLEFPSRYLIYLGSAVPEEAEMLFTDASSPNNGTAPKTLIGGAWKIAGFEDCTNEIIAQQEDHAVIWYDRCGAHKVFLEYVKD